jgi:GTPase Era involved in 16S rRNA processing
MSNSGTFTGRGSQTVTGITGISTHSLWIDDNTHSISAVHNNVTVTPLETIQGKCIQAQKIISSHDILSATATIDTEEIIKKELIRQLAEEMMRSKCVEFTKQYDTATGGYVFRARIFVTPDDRVRLLRQANVIK